MFFIVVCFFVVKTCNTKYAEVLISNCRDVVFVHNNLRLADKLALPG